MLSFNDIYTKLKNGGFVFDKKIRHCNLNLNIKSRSSFLQNSTYFVLGLYRQTD